MRRLWMIPICFAALAVPVVVLAGGGASGFEGVVSSLETRYQVHANRIPFLGIISLISRKATHDGVSGIHVAEFENFHGDVDGEELNSMVERKLGPGWERVIRETSRNGGGQTLIFMHPEGDRMGLFVLDLDGHEMDVVQVSVDPDHLGENLSHYEHHHDHRDSDDGDHDRNESD
jgi:hypothetical protein